MNSKLKLFLLAPVFAFAISCSGGASITLEKNEFNVLGLSNVTPRYGQTGINFSLSDSLKFKEADKSSYRVENTMSIKEASFATSNIASANLNFSDWSYSYTSEESEKKAYGYSCTVTIIGTDYLPTDGTIKVEVTSNFIKGDSTLATFTGNITFTVKNPFASN